MSVTMTLFPVAIVMSLTTKKRAEEHKEALVEHAPIETIFSNGVLLEQTLRERGLAVTALSEHQLICDVGDMRLQYHQQAAGEPFWLTVSGIQNMDDFLAEMECYEREYRQNVQSYTYGRLKNNLRELNMNVADETLLEDDSILLTIDV
jgi:hypothetical protein